MRVTRMLRLAVVGVALLGASATAAGVAHHQAAQGAVHAQGVGNFDGPWYFGGDLTSPALIIQAGTSLLIMNEQGRPAQATANINQIAANWGEGPITGTLTPDQRQINWTNGTFWQRQALIDVAALGTANIGGIWYVGDEATRRALIVQHPGGQIQLMNEQGRISQGVFSGPNTIVAAAWEGGVSGTLSPDGNFIGWSNGTNWRR